MPLSSRARNKIVGDINGQFLTIGSKLPTRSKDNHASTSWEYWVACHLAMIANKRKEKAEKDAVKEGILIDKEKKPRPEGTNEVIFSGDLIRVSLEVRKGRTVIDPDKFSSYLAARGVKTELLEEAYNFAESTTRPAHVFRADIQTVDEDTGK